ncbi:MAG: anthranilate synthase component I family protein [Planctomycetia bacterium]|nr:anthranilate synthase component I family protein [Planctomycetia bacterium]
MRPAALQFDTRSAFETDEGCRVEPWDAELDVEAVLARLSRHRHCLFLDSARRDPALGRYSFLTADPFDYIELSAGGHDRLVELECRMARWRSNTVPRLPPFQGGAAGLFSYDMGRWLEKVPEPRIDEFQTPALAIGFYDVVLAIDHLERRAWIISQGLPETDRDARRRRAAERLDQFRAWLSDPPPRRSRRRSVSIPDLSINELAPHFSVPGPAGLVSNFSAERYLQAVRRAIEYIHAGDVFQVNIAQRLLFPADDDSLQLYLRLRNRNPATFAGYFDLGGSQIVSASPERFLKVSSMGDVEARPIKGTRQRTARPEADLFAGEEMLQNEKDRAENVMIVDLLRNDLARVCEPDSVRVTQLCRLETYQYVQHLVSAVCGKLAEGRGPSDLLRASFPGGSITGAPKVRAMEIIAELEPTARGAYCGALGYLGFDGALDTSILIRTITAGRGWWQAPVGGGIVAQSDPQREYEETWHKAIGLVRALE